MHTCERCLNDFAYKPVAGHYCSVRCHKLDARELAEASRDRSTIKGLFKTIQGGLMKLNHGLAEDEVVTE